MEDNKFDERFSFLVFSFLVERVGFSAGEKELKIEKLFQLSIQI